VASTRIEGRLIIELMRGCLTEISASLKSLRREAEAGDPQVFPVAKNAVLFSLDMNIAAIHMLGSKLADETAAVELTDAERLLIGMSATFMSEPVARLIDDALEGLAVSDERVRRELSASESAERSKPPLH
jgi:hypothetical protein